MQHNSSKSDLILGAHMSISQGYAFALTETAGLLDCNALQIFLKSPRGGRPKPLLSEDVSKFKSEYERCAIKYLVAHSSYLLNLAKPLGKDDWQFENLNDDIIRLGALGGGDLVYHVGKYLKLDRAEAIEHLLENLNYILPIAADKNVNLLLENCAGQGTEMGTELEEIAYILDKINRKNLKVCIDSCHAFAAGYELSNKESVVSFFNTMESIIGLENVNCFHFNNSIHPVGSRKDRHANLLSGAIAEEGMKEFAYQAYQANKPILLETPLINDTHLEDVQVVKSWFKHLIK